MPTSARHHFPFLSLLLVLGLMLGLGLTLAAAGRADPLPLKLMPSKSFSDVQAEAAYESVNGPVYSNSPDPKTLPFHATLTGTVTADATMNKLAIFSDDGSDVYVDGVKVWNTKDQGQALPDLPNSLHELPGTLSPGSHTVEIDYSNVIYGAPDPTTGQPVDIDGCTLFVYGSAPPVVTLTADDPGDPDEFQQVTSKVYASVDHLPAGHSASDLTATWTWAVVGVTHSDTVDGTYTTDGVDAALFSVTGDNADLTSPTATFKGEFDLDGFYEVEVQATVKYHDNRTGEDLGPYGGPNTPADIYLGDTGDEPPAGSASGASTPNVASPMLARPALSSGTSATPPIHKKILTAGLRIYLAGQDVTGSTVTLNAGEQVALKAQYNKKGGTASISSPSWSIKNTPIGGWTNSDTAHNKPDASYTAPTPSTSATSITFYYTDTTQDGTGAATSTPVTFSGTVGKSVTKTVNFIVRKPSTTLSAAQHDVIAGQTNGSIRVIALGGPKYGSGLNGIDFTATGGAGGTFSWGQLLTAFTYTNTITAQGQTASGNFHASNTPGLDTGFPYRSTTATTTDDSPEITVDTAINPYVTSIKVTNFTATMYLMWTSSKPNSIPIPVQSLTWSWTGLADTSRGDWEKISGTIPQTYTGTPVKSGVLSWSQIAHPGVSVKD